MAWSAVSNDGIVRGKSTEVGRGSGGVGTRLGFFGSGHRGQDPDTRDDERVA